MHVCSQHKNLCRRLEIIVFRTHRLRIRYVQHRLTFSVKETILLRITITYISMYTIYILYIYMNKIISTRACARAYIYYVLVVSAIRCIFGIVSFPDSDCVHGVCRATFEMYSKINHDKVIRSKRRKY